MSTAHLSERPARSTSVFPAWFDIYLILELSCNGRDEASVPLPRGRSSTLRRSVIHSGSLRASFVRLL